MSLIQTCKSCGVEMKDVKINRALVSVSDKSGVVEFARALAEMGVEIISTGGTAKALSEANTAEWHRLRSQAVDSVAPPGVRDRIREFLDFWHSNAPDVSAESVALALLSAAQVEQRYRGYQNVELAWTGPDSQVIPLRRTDQALLQLIKAAHDRLHIVSFAVYKAEAVIQALVTAARRGVVVAIYLETPDASERKITFDTLRALGGEIPQHARIYVWPLEQRLKTSDGKHGSLHAKIAVADGRDMLITSANLTEYALTLNMELGLLVRGGPLPAQVERHLSRLVEQGVFQTV